MWLSGHLVKLPFIAGVAWSKNDQEILKKMVVVKKRHKTDCKVLLYVLKCVNMIL
jgi:hypothetical protein